MKGCEDFEVEIEMRLHEALASAAELDAHLAGCSSCRAFEGMAKQMETTMTTTALAETRAIDWEAMKAGFRRRVTTDVWKRAAVAIAVVGCEMIATATFEPNHGLFAQILPTLVLAVVAVLVVSVAIGFGRRWQMRAYETNKADFHYFHRAYLEGRLLRTWLVGLLSIPLGLTYWLCRIPRAHVPAIEWAGASLMAILFIGIGAYALGAHRPRLRRELDDLKRQA